MASLVGLEPPLFDLKNPGLISIPLGFAYFACSTGAESARQAT